MDVAPQIVFSDWDGTLTRGHELTPLFFDIIHLLKEKNIPLVIVTGRSKSWAHFFLSHIPSFQHVISEGGGVLSVKDSQSLISDELMIEKSEVLRLEHFTENLMRKFPKLKLSTDSFGRETDRAIELCDLAGDSKMNEEIQDYMKENKINFSTSNVHLNFWCGKISKYSSVKSFLKRFYHQTLMEQCLYFGDSLNDQSMFRHFKNSVGVSNIKTIIDQLQWKPSTILQGEQNEGPNGVLNYLGELLK